MYQRGRISSDHVAVELEDGAVVLAKHFFASTVTLKPNSACILAETDRGLVLLQLECPKLSDEGK